MVRIDETEQLTSRGDFGAEVYAAPMSDFDDVVGELVSAVVDALEYPDVALTGKIEDLLLGAVADRVRSLVPKKVRSRDGIFFTGSRVRESVFKGLVAPESGLIVDPACGAGDLLLEASRALPIGDSLADTLCAWGARLAGADIHASFVRAARARLILEAVRRHQASGSVGAVGPRESVTSAFPLIQLGDGLQALRTTHDVSMIVMNPPFAAVQAPETYRWGAGLVTQAAVFLDVAVEVGSPTTSIVAILPDVIRTGSRFARLRTHLEGSLALEGPVALGQFDEHTDIDVFLLRGVRRQDPSDAGSEADASDKVAWWDVWSGRTVGEHFEIRVGTVVDNRDPHEGELRGFMKAKDLPFSGEAGAVSRHRCHGGRAYEPPFVVVRRTSRPSAGQQRSPGVLVRTGAPVYVDNHLMVLTPNDRTIARCEELILNLGSPEVTLWLDDRIRCRHLTVGALEETPWLR